MLLPRTPLIFVAWLVPFSAAQSSTSSNAPSSASSSSPTTRPATRTGTQTENATTTFPTTGTVTLSANGTATATIVNGTIVNATSSATPTSTSAEAFPTLGDSSGCVVACLEASVSAANCSSITEVSCFCPSATFRNTTVNCVETQCRSELNNAEALAQRFCNMVSVTLSFPSPTLASGGTRLLRRPAALAASCALAGVTWLVFG